MSIDAILKGMGFVGVEIGKIILNNYVFSSLLFIGFCE